ncbi:MAG: pyridoxamine 5'-phosphate oxidase family protein [Pikeienuella sp.]
MRRVASIAALEALYEKPGEAATVKVAPRLTPAYRRWIERSRFCVLTTVGPEGVDGSPRGDDGPVAAILDEGTLALPDWRGNQRLDSLRNIVRDGRAALMFLVPGSNNVIRVNGTAFLTDDEGLRARFARKGLIPATVVVLEIAEVYSQCARALLRARLWSSGDESDGLPSVGEMLEEITKGGIDGAFYDSEWPGRAAQTMW